MTAGTAPTFSAAFDNNNHMVGFSYDENGNQLNTPDGATLSYDWDNRMTNWSSGGASEVYHYHPSGWRVWKKPSTGAGTLYLHGPSGNLLCEQADDWSGPPADYIYFGGRLLYTVRKEGGTWTRTALLTDRRGSVRNGGKSYYPFGEEIGTSANNAFKFASTYRDSNSGLDYAHHRYYSSGMARFLSADPGRARRHNPGSWNRHRYAGNDPVNRIDPLGLDDYTDFLCLVYGDCEGGGEEEPYDVGFKVKVVATAPLPEPLDTVPSELPPLAPPPGDEPGGGGGGGDGGDGPDESCSVEGFNGRVDIEPKEARGNTVATGLGEVLGPQATRGRLVGTPTSSVAFVPKGAAVSLVGAPRFGGGIYNPKYHVLQDFKAYRPESDKTMSYLGTIHIEATFECDWGARTRVAWDLAVMVMNE